MDERVAAVEAAKVVPRRLPFSVLVAGIGIVALVAIALLVAVIRPSRSVDYPSGSPEATFQDFYVAWDAGDLEDAYAFFSSSVTAEMTLDQFRRADDSQVWLRDRDQRVVLLGAELDGDRATLHVRVDTFDESDGLGGGRYTSERSVRLVRERGAWLIDEPLSGVETIYPF